MCLALKCKQAPTCRGFYMQRQQSGGDQLILGYGTSIDIIANYNVQIWKKIGAGRL